MSDDATPHAEPTLDDWKALAAKDLKGRSPDDLTRTRPEGIDVKPLYTAADVEAAIRVALQQAAITGSAPSGSMATSTSSLDRSIVSRCQRSPAVGVHRSRRLLPSA